MNNSSDELRKELTALGAREFQIVALSGDPERGLAAIAEARRRGVEHVVGYAITIFDNAAWTPTGELRRGTNLHVEKVCTHCGGDRFVPVTDDWRNLYGETWAPCIECNAEADTKRWAGNERRVTAPQ